MKRILILLFLTVPLSLKSQQAQEYFGKNRIQERAFDWKFISTINFDVYYYEGGKELAEHAARVAEEDFARITELIGFSPDGKIKLIIFRTEYEKRQSNIGVEDPNYFSGGQTNFVKSKLEVAYRGDQVTFRNDISGGVAGLLVNLMIYGGSLKEVVQTSYLISVPDWFVKGAAAYVAEGWSRKMDNFMRDSFLNRKIKSPESFSGDESTLAGQSVWNYIVQVYGKRYVADILGVIGTLRNQEQAIEANLGVPYKVFLQNWRRYYNEMSMKTRGHFKYPDPSNEVFDGKSGNIASLSSNSSGTFAVVTINTRGKRKVYLLDLLNHRKKKLKKEGHKVANQEILINYPLVSWKNDSVIGLITEKNNKLFFYTYELKRKKWNSIELINIEDVYSFDISHDEKFLVLSAWNNGTTDLMLYDLAKSKAEILVKNSMDELCPVFNSGKIYYASETKFYPSLNFSSGIFSGYNLFEFDLSTHVIKRLSEGGTYGRPRFESGQLYFLNDQTGISEIYKVKGDSSRSPQTNFVSDITDFDIAGNKNAIVSTFVNGNERIYLVPLQDSLSQPSFLTERQQIHTGVRELKPVKDTSKTSETIDIYNYVFESEIEPHKKDTLKTSKGKVHAIKILGPSPYEGLFSADRLTTSLMVDPLKGTGILLETAMSDMFGNHRMTGGVFGLVDLKSSNLYGEYQYLKNRIDYKARYDRQTFYASTADASQRYTLNQLTLTAALPISTRQRISFSPEIVSTKFTDYDSLPNPDVNLYYYGAKVEYVFDNTLIYGLNLIEGTRAKVAIEKLNSFESKSRTFGKFTFDLRHYQKIYRVLTFATRASGGAFFGNAKKEFLIGGMDNWLFNTTAHSGSEDPLTLRRGTNNSDLLFLRFITNLRGFSYNAQHGNKFLLYNAELRLPVAKFFYRGAINSNFIKNFQLVSFLDVGSAWSGTSPFTKNNSVNTQVVNSPPFNATVVNYQSPFLIGFGGGVRTLFLGYFMKFDVAWGYVNNTVQHPKYYLSFGYDF